MDIKIFTSDRLTDDLSASEIKNLVDEFRQYKKTSISTIFGRDVPYDRPHSAKSAELQHLHVHPNFLLGKPINKFTNELKTWRLLSAPISRTSDTHLIYCQGERNKNEYLLIAFIKINAHSFANITSAIGVLADKAENFRKKH
jgi:mRNA interferase YafO